MKKFFDLGQNQQCTGLISGFVLRDGSWGWSRKPYGGASNETWSAMCKAINLPALALN